MSQELDQPTPRIGQVFTSGIFLRHTYTQEYGFIESNWRPSWWFLAPTWWWTIIPYCVTEAWPAINHFFDPYNFLCHPYTTENICTGICWQSYVWVLALIKVWTLKAWISQSDRQKWCFAFKLCLRSFLGSQTAISTWYLPMSPLYTGLCFYWIPRVASLMVSGSQLVVKYNLILCQSSLVSLKPVFLFHRPSYVTLIQPKIFTL